MKDKKITVECHRTIYKTVKVENIAEFDKRYRGYRIDSIDDKIVFGRCEGCDDILLNDDESWSCDSEGANLCSECFSQLLDAREISNEA